MCSFQAVSHYCGTIWFVLRYFFQSLLSALTLASRASLCSMDELFFLLHEWFTLNHHSCFKGGISFCMSGMCWHS